MIKLNLERITDPATRDAFEILDRFIKGQKILFGMQFYDLDFEGAVANAIFAHTLGSVPKDVIQTRKVGAGSVIYNYDAFTNRFISITTTGPCSVRFFVGTYKEE